jgi:hypothetical protein
MNCYLGSVADDGASYEVRLQRVKAATTVYLRTLVRSKNKQWLPDWTSALMRMYSDNLQVCG